MPRVVTFFLLARVLFVIDAEAVRWNAVGGHNLALRLSEGVRLNFTIVLLFNWSFVYLGTFLNTAAQNWAFRFYQL